MLRTVGNEQAAQAPVSQYVLNVASTGNTASINWHRVDLSWVGGGGFGVGDEPSHWGSKYNLHSAYIWHAACMLGQDKGLQFFSQVS